MAEKSIYKKNARELFFFARYGAANQKVSNIDYTWTKGLALNGVIEGRDNSQLGFGISQAHLGSSYAQTVANNKQVTRRTETALELTYSDKLASWLQIQPDLQYVMKPAASPVDNSSQYLENATVAMLRFNITF